MTDERLIGDDPDDGDGDGDDVVSAVANPRTIVDAAARAALRELVPGDVIFDEPMRRHTTAKMGGPADAFVRPSSIERLEALVGWCAARGADVDQPVGVDRRAHGVALLPALAAGGLDQPAGEVAGRVLERRAVGRDLLRLARRPPGPQPLDVGLDVGARPRGQRQRRPHHHLGRRQIAGPVAEAAGVVIAPDPSKSHRKRCKVTHSVRDVLVCGNSLYVASRAEKAIYSCGADFGTPQPFITGLQDNPEFLIYAAS